MEETSEEEETVRTTRFKSLRELIRGRSRRVCRPLARAGALAVLALAPTEAQAAVDSEAQFILNTLAFPGVGSSGDVDGGGIHHARGRVCAHQERLDDLSQEHRPLLHRRADVLLHRLQPHVRRRWRGRTHRFAQAPLRHVRRRGSNSSAATRKPLPRSVGNGHAVMSDWFFQMVFVATTASIVSGALAERVKLWSFFIFIAVLTAFIYPIVGAWTWGGGWLSAMGFKDFAGSTIVHSTGGWAGPRGCAGRGGRGGASSVMTARSSRPLRPTFRLSRWASSSSGSGGSGSMADRNWP